MLSQLSATTSQSNARQKTTFEAPNLQKANVQTLYQWLQDNKQQGARKQPSEPFLELVGFVGLNDGILRLMELGLVPSTLLQPLPYDRHSPLLAIALRGYILSIRVEEAANILVRRQCAAKLDPLS